MAGTNGQNGWTAEVSGRAFPNAGCAAAWAQAVLARETEKREMRVLDRGALALIVQTAGDGIVITRGAGA